MKAGEFELIDRIRRQTPGAAGLHLGIGDDCSVIEVPAGHQLLTSTDLLLEDIHFRLDWTDLASLAAKAVAVNVSDIAAMGGNPLSLHLGLALPGHFSDDQFEQFSSGLFPALADYDLFLAGGDTCRSSGPLMISITVQGHARRDRLVTRSGAAVGDDLWVSGSLGDSALALNYLQSQQSLSSYLAERHFRPRARVDLGRLLAESGLASAMIDLSDGLSGDLRHLLRASDVGARVDLEGIPLSAEFRAALTREEALLDLALCGGEDYELLFSAHPSWREKIEAASATLQLPLQRIGVIEAGADLIFCRGDGQSYRPQRSAFDHFAEGGEASRG